MTFRNVIKLGLRDLLTDRRGGAAAELAVVIPFLALLALGVADFGRAYVMSSVVAHAAEAGAHYGAQSTVLASDSVSIRIAATADAADVGTINVSSTTFCNCGSGTVNCSTGTCPGYGDGSPRFFLQVTATKTFSFILRYPGLPASIAMSRTAVMRVQ